MSRSCVDGRVRRGATNRLDRERHELQRDFLFLARFRSIRTAFDVRGELRAVRQGNFHREGFFLLVRLNRYVAFAESRGELKSIRSSLPGADVGELLPHTSRVMHLATTIRSVTHPYPIHGAAFALTGVGAIDVPMELNPRDPRHHPFIGSVVAYLDRKHRDVPTNLALPWPFSTQRTGEVHRAGPYAAFLGSAFNPTWTS